MATDIEWTADPKTGAKGEVWNFLRGCSRDNEECDSCYAMYVSRRGLHAVDAGLTKLRPKGSKRPGVDWTGKIAVMPERLGIPLRWRRPRNVFVNSMSDLFHPGVPFEVIAAAFGVMAATPMHTYQVLTKRPERAAEFFAWAQKKGASYELARPKGMPSPLLECAWEACVIDCDEINENWAWTMPSVDVFGNGWPLPNVHLGVSAGRQETADEKIPALLGIPAAVRWVSIEPMIGPVDLAGLPNNIPGHHGWDFFDALSGRPVDTMAGEVGDPTLPSLDWIVVGGESGSKPRPCDLDWLRSVLRQCQAAGKPAFIKQLGGHPVSSNPSDLRFYNDLARSDPASYSSIEAGSRIKLKSSKGGDPSEWPKDLRVRQWPA